MNIDVLQARDGDCLLLHWDDRVAVVDGGPTGTYREALAPRLDELRAQRGLHADQPLVIDLVLVTHIDGDHIGGLLAWLRELAQASIENRITTTIDRLWFNSFEDILAHEIPGRLAVEAARETGGNRHTAARRAVIASVPQGRELHQLAARLRIDLNGEFDGYPIAAAIPGEPSQMKAIHGLQITVVAPPRDRLVVLQEEWAKLSDAAIQGAGTIAAYSDSSVYNLSSVACLVRHGQTSALLTGDALGSDVLDGLGDLGLLKPPLHVTALKLPHHGSARSIDLDFFEAITADHYIASGNGRHGNPDLEILDMLAMSRRDDDFALHLTYLGDGIDHHRERMAEWVAAQRSVGRRFAIYAATSPRPGLVPRIRI